jgi:hypothetical protein
LLPNNYFILKNWFRHNFFFLNFRQNLIWIKKYLTMAWNPLKYM